MKLPDGHSNLLAVVGDDAVYVAQTSYHGGSAYRITPQGSMTFDRGDHGKAEGRDLDVFDCAGHVYVALVPYNEGFEHVLVFRMRPDGFDGPLDLDRRQASEQPFCNSPWMEVQGRCVDGKPTLMYGVSGFSPDHLRIMQFEWRD